MPGGPLGFMRSIWVGILQIHEKPAMEMTRHIRPLYVKAHLNGKLVDNVMPLRMLRVLGMSIDDLIET